MELANSPRYEISKLELHWAQSERGQSSLFAPCPQKNMDRASCQHETLVLGLELQRIQL